jgi:L-lactate dehydrogenase complex protein LldG
MTAGDARAEILVRIGTALGRHPGHPVPAPSEVPRDYETASPIRAGAPELLALLVDRLIDYRATVHRCSAADLAATVAAVLAARGHTRLVVPAGLGPWLDDWAAAPGHEKLVDDPEASLSIADLDRADGVVSGCAVAVAETGTIVLDAGPDQGRRALTLVPDYHLVVVRAEQVVADVPDGVERMDPGRPLTLISGPSATSDIELDRVEGVHGPRTLEVVVVDGPTTEG